MTAPALAGILLFTIYPVIKLIQLSLMNTNMLNPSQSKFIGLDNYRKVLSRPDFHKSLNNTVVYTIAVVAFRAKCKMFSRHLQKPILKTEKGRFKGL